MTTTTAPTTTTTTPRERWTLSRFPGGAVISTHLGGSACYAWERKIPGVPWQDWPEHVGFVHTRPAATHHDPRS